MRRWFRRLRIPVLLAALLGGAWFWADHRIDELERGLVRRSADAFERRYDRPVAADALSGSYASAVIHEFPMLLEATAPWVESDYEPIFERCFGVRAGMWPASDLPLVCREIVEASRPELDGLLDATRAGQIGDTKQLHDIAWWVMIRAASMAALDARLALHRGDTVASLHRCTGLLGLWRDGKFGARLGGWTTSATFVDLALYPCADALDLADASTKRDARRAIAMVASGVPPLSQAVREDAVHSELVLFGPALRDDRYQALPALARSLIDNQPAMELNEQSELPPLLRPFFLYGPWNDYARTMERIAVIVDGPPLAAHAAIDTIASDENLDVLARSTAATRWHKHLATDHIARARVDLLLAVATVDLHHAQHGRWPATATTGDIPRLAPEASLELTVTAPTAKVTVRYAVPEGSRHPRGNYVTLHPD